jgi:hypothetical protein
MTASRRMAIIGCRLTEDEIVHVVSRDDEVANVRFVDNEECKGLARKLSRIRPEIRIEYVKEESLESLAVTDGLSLLIWMKDMGLHESPEKLKNNMTQTLEKTAPQVSSILMFYDLCGNAFKDIGDVSEALRVLITILTDSRGETVDDCIAAVVGGRLPYQTLVKKELGVFFLTPMWASNWREMAVKTRIVPDGHNYDLMRMVFETSSYKKVLKIETGLGEPGEYERNAEEFAGIFNFTMETMKGDLKLVEKSYAAARRSAV